MIRASALALIVSASAAPAWAERFRVFTDPGATHEILSIEEERDALRSVVVKRTDRSGDAYIRQRINCRSRRFQIIAYGLEEKDLERKAPNPTTEAVVAGAISEEIWRRACRRP